MKVFLSWSGDLSRNVALILREWLPSVIQSIEPYVSSEDIDKGTRWSTDIGSELEASSFGILCVTHENLEAAWLHFEAGALSKAMEKSYVCPFLFGIKKSEVKGPLIQFQMTSNEEADIRKLLHSLNSACETDALEKGRLDSTFDVWWPHLKGKLEKLVTVASVTKPSTSPEKSQNSEILEEILELTRDQQKLLRAPDILLPADYLEHVFSRLGLLQLNSPKVRSAIRDLETSLKNANSIIESSSKEEDSIRSAEIKDLVRKIEGPLRYILRNIKDSQISRRIDHYEMDRLMQTQNI